NQWTVAGRSIPKVNGRELVTGRHRFVSDLKREGMLHGKVLRPPAAGATLGSVDPGPAAAMPGVTVVRDGDFVGVTAPSALQAARARDAIHAEWKTTEQPKAAELFELLKRAPARALHVPEDKVRVIVPDTGAGYGGKHSGECAIEAARLAKTAGRPVKLAWTREEEFAWAYFRPAGVIEVKSGVGEDGRLVAWE